MRPLTLAALALVLAACTSPGDQPYPTPTIVIVRSTPEPTPDPTPEPSYGPLPAIEPIPYDDEYLCDEDPDACDEEDEES
jgi:hypothetical protein